MLRIKTESEFYETIGRLMRARESRIIPVRIGWRAICMWAGRCIKRLSVPWRRYPRISYIYLRGLLRQIGWRNVIGPG